MSVVPIGENQATERESPQFERGVAWMTKPLFPADGPWEVQLSCGHTVKMEHWEGEYALFRERATCPTCRGQSN